jgi:hypothetical protein
MQDIFFPPQNSRNIRCDTGSISGAGDNFQPPAEKRSPFTHAEHPNAFLVQSGCPFFGMIKTNTVVFDSQQQSIRDTSQFNSYLVGIRMFEYIIERLLADTKQSQLNIRREPILDVVVFKCKVAKVGFLSELLDQTVQCGHQAQFIESLRPQTTGNIPDLIAQLGD